MAQQQVGYGEKWRRPLKTKRAMSKTPNKKPLASQSRQRLKSGPAQMLYWKAFSIGCPF
jgi:hypothetical protein